MARPRSPSLNGGMQAVAPAEDLAAAGPELLLEELHRSTVMLAAVGRRRAVLLRAARAAGVSRLELLEAARLTPGRGRLPQAMRRLASGPASVDDGQALEDLGVQAGGFPPRGRPALRRLGRAGAWPRVSWGASGRCISALAPAAHAL